MNIIIIVVFGPYWSIDCLQELSMHPDTGPASSCSGYNPSSLFQPPDRSTRCLLSSLALSFNVGSRSRLDMWYRSLAFGGCVHFIFIAFRGFHLLLIVAWSVSGVLCCWWFRAIGFEGFFSGRCWWNVWIFSVAAVVLHVSAHSGTGFTVVLKTLILTFR